MSRHAKPPRIRYLVALIVVIPMSAVIAFAQREVVEHRQRSHRLEALHAQVEIQRSLVEVNVVLDNSLVWMAAVERAEGMGFSTELVEQVTGIDLDGANDLATKQLEDLWGEVERLDLLDTVEAALAVASQGEVPDEDPLLHLMERGLLDVTRLAAQVGNNHRIYDLASIVRSTNDTRSALSRLNEGYFFRLVSRTDDNYSELASSLGRYEDSLERLDRVTAAADVASIRERFPVIATDFAVAEEAIRAELETRLPSNTVESTTAVSFVGDFSAIGEIARLAASTQSSFTELVFEALDMLSTEVDFAISQSRHEARNTAFVTAAVVLLTLLGSATVSRLIVKPVTTLWRWVDAIKRGKHPEDLAVKGPSEVRGVAEVLNEFRGGLDLVTAQAKALAEADLDEPCLQTLAPGELGRSLHVAVRALQTSIVEGERYRSKLSAQATSDELTGLPNRRGAMEELERRIDQVRTNDNCSLMLMVLDIDRFKHVNDTAGHAAGDDILCHVARTLSANISDTGFVARLGGDEFMILESLSQGDLQPAKIAARLQQESSHSAQLEMRSVGTSLGFALWDGHVISDFMSDADLALYEAKTLGGNLAIEFNTAMAQQRNANQDLEERLNVAVDCNELQLFFQPIVNGRSRKIVAFEALLRWDDVPTDRLVSVAEQSSLILKLDRWVLNEGIRHAAGWNRELAVGPVGISINVSAHHLVSGDLVASVRDSLKVWGLSPNLLTVEITEEAVVEDLTRAAATIERLRRLKVGVAIDDYGSGNASLSHLRALPANILKVDRSITMLEHPRERALLGLTVGTGKALGMDVVVEGIESAAQADFVAKEFPDVLAQGFYYCEPVPLGQVERLLSSSEREINLSCPVARQ